MKYKHLIAVVGILALGLAGGFAISIAKTAHAGINYPASATLGPGSITNVLIGNSAVTNAKVSASAAIAWSKLASPIDTFFTATTSNVQLSTTTLSGIPAMDHIHFEYQASTTGGIVPQMYFNNDFTSTFYAEFEQNLGGTTANSNGGRNIPIGSSVGGASGEYSFQVDIVNRVGYPKIGTFMRVRTINGNIMGDVMTGGFIWGSTTPRITSISITTGQNLVYFATSTFMQATGF